MDVEIVQPGKMLRDRYGLDWLAFSYPFGARLPGVEELRLYEAGVFQAAFGIRGFAPAGTPRYRLDRACAEGYKKYAVFGKVAARFLRGH